MASATPAPSLAHLIAGHVLSVDHVGVAVADLDAGVATFAALLGLVEVHREENRQQGVVEAMLVPATLATSAADVSTPSHQPAVAMQILAPLDEHSVLHGFLDKRGPGLQQLAYQVDDLDAVLVVLRAAGVRILDGAPAVGTAGSRVAFVHPHDAAGVLIELVERPR